MSVKDKKQIKLREINSLKNNCVLKPGWMIKNQTTGVKFSILSNTCQTIGYFLVLECQITAGCVSTNFGGRLVNIDRHSGTICL